MVASISTEERVTDLASYLRKWDEGNFIYIVRLDGISTPLVTGQKSEAKVKRKISTVRLTGPLGCLITCYKTGVGRSNAGKLIPVKLNYAELY